MTTEIVKTETTVVTDTISWNEAAKLSLIKLSELATINHLTMAVNHLGSDNHNQRLCKSGQE